jgi:hypothetical protein
MRSTPSFLLILLFAMLPATGHALTKEEMQDMINRKACPNERGKLSHPNLTAMCGAANATPVLEYNECLNRFFAIDQFAYKWNTFIDKCSAKSSDQPENWGKRVVEAQRRAETYSTDTSISEDEEEYRTYQETHPPTESRTAPRPAAAGPAPTRQKLPAVSSDRSPYPDGDGRWYPPNCRNKVSFAACAYDHKGCDFTGQACLQICGGLCND